MCELFKEVSVLDYSNWNLKLSKTNPKYKDLKEFESEIQNWNLYDLTYIQSDRYGKKFFIREYGIPTPYLQLYLSNHFSPQYDFSKNGVSNLKITPHNVEFRNKKLNDGSYQGDFERTIFVQIQHLRNWREMLKSKN